MQPLTRNGTQGRVSFEWPEGTWLFAFPDAALAQHWMCPQYLRALAQHRNRLCVIPRTAVEEFHYSTNQAVFRDAHQHVRWPIRDLANHTASELEAKAKEAFA